MKRKFISIILFVLFPFFIMAQNLSGEIYCTIPTVKDFNNQNFSGEIKFNADYLNIETDAGFKFNNSQFQFTTRGFYMPQIINGLQIGGGLNYHFFNQENIFTENNLLISARARYTSIKKFTVETAYSLFMVFTCINSIKSTSPCLFNLNSGIEVLMSQTIFDGLKVYLNITSFDYFDYPLLGTPFIKTGIEYNFFDRYSALVDYTMKFEDMFTSTVYVSGSYLRIGAKVEI